MDNNLELLARVAQRLAGSEQQFVFVGGTVVGLLITDGAAEAPRPTHDVDVIVEVAGYADYHQRLAPELKRLGFHEHADAATTSHDLEDIVRVIDGRQELADEVARSSLDVRAYVQSEFEALLKEDEFLNALPGMLEAGREASVLERLRAIAGRR